MKTKILEIISKYLRLIIFNLSNLERNLNPEKNGNNPYELHSKNLRIRVRAEKLSNENFCDFLVSRPLFRNGEDKYLFSFPQVIPYNYVGDFPEGVKKILEVIYDSEICVWVAVYPFKIKVQLPKTIDREEAIPKINELLLSYLEKQTYSRLKKQAPFLVS